MTLAFAPERIETWPLARLQPYAKNAKTHGPEQVAKIAASMAEFGADRGPRSHPGGDAARADGSAGDSRGEPERDQSGEYGPTARKS